MYLHVSNLARDYHLLSPAAPKARDILQRPPSVRPSVCLSVRHA